MGSIITLSIVQSALELGFIYALVALALFVSFSILDIADLSTDGCFTLGCAVCATVTLAGHPVLGLFAAAAAGVVSGFVTAFLQTRMGNSVHLSWNHRKYRIIHDQHCGDGFCIQYQSFFL